MREAYRFHQLRENRHVLPSLIEAYRELLRDNDMLVDVVDDQILQDSLRRVGRGKPTDLVVVPPSPKKRSSTTAGFFAQRIIAAQTPSPSHSGPRMIPIFSDLPRGNQERVSPRYTRITNPAYIPRDVEKVDLPCYKEAALPVPEKPDERAFDPHAPVLIKRDRTANLDSMYTSEDIEAILRIKINLLQERQHIALLAAEDWGNNVIKPALERYLEGRELDAVPFKHIILPICMTTAVHWVGVRLSVLDNNQIGISYYDSLPQDQGWTTRRDQVMSQAIEAAKQLFNGKKISVRDYPWLEQTDPTSCGAYLIENVYYSLKLKEDDSDYWRPNAPDLALQIRTRHLDLLQQYRNDYYETVLRKACTDEEAEEGPFKRQRNLPAFPT